MYIHVLDSGDLYYVIYMVEYFSILIENHTDRESTMSLILDIIIVSWVERSSSLSSLNIEIFFLGYYRC